MPPNEEGLRLAEDWIVVCIAPDVCLTPVGPSMVPVPYQIFARGQDSKETEQKVFFTSQPAFTQKSLVAQVQGNEAGTGGGIMSGINRGIAEWASHSPTVRAGKNFVNCAQNLFSMNASARQAARNTFGKAIWNGATAAAKAPVGIARGFVQGVKDQVNDVIGQAEGALEGAEKVPPGQAGVGAALGYGQAFVEQGMDDVKKLWDYGKQGKYDEGAGWTASKMIPWVLIGKAIRKGVRISQRAKKVADAYDKMEKLRKARRRLARG